eukprot:1968910-Rhodomonas_salina.2
MAGLSACERFRFDRERLSQHPVATSQLKFADFHSSALLRFLPYESGMLIRVLYRVLVFYD